jgi:nicotinamidase-related amidase
MKIIAFLLLTLSSITAIAQDNQNTTALLVIDIQDFYFPEGDIPLSEPALAAKKANQLILHFREMEMPIVYIKHNYEPGGEINEIVMPQGDDKIILKNNANSFLDTDLDSYLKEIGIINIVICGMQTHMCVEAATRAGADLGYKCTVIDDACATRDLKYGDNLVLAKDVHFSTLSTLKSYAKVMTTDEFLREN